MRPHPPTPLWSLTIEGTMPGLNELTLAKGNSYGRGMSGYTKLKKEWGERIVRCVRGRGETRTRPIAAPVHVHIIYCEPDARRDHDNIDAGGRKLLLDGLVLAGVLAGDGPRHVRDLLATFRKPSNECPCVRIDLYDASATCVRITEGRA